ncbi:hypothetical protein PV327_003726 [Microctonus hyperodae]|uniref:Uncharacterized protein n=1 Tax=Microctonus hyperodae TaxID=165561 RepID=A0AA39G4K6_MICHY|nr:hypothetical protein PV327_003726 [Microctonus hyperodae]
MYSNADVTKYPKLYSSQSMLNFHRNDLLKVSPVFLHEDKRATNLDIKNHYDRKRRHRVSTTKPLNEPRKLTNIPSLYLEPPANIKHQWNNKFKKNSRAEKSKKNSSTKNRDDINPVYIRDHAPVQQHQQTTQINDDNDSKEIKKQEKTNDENSERKNRVDFHVHGHQGPNSYIFGFDTGSGKNRQFRLEEKHKNGTVTGHYGYYDARGKLRKIYYTSDPMIEYQEITNGHAFGQ